MIKIKTYTKDKIPDVIEFERRLRKEENFWGWEIDQNQVNDIKKSFKDPCFGNAVCYWLMKTNILLEELMLH